MHILFSADLLLLTIALSALIVSAIKSVNYGPGWMFASETRANVVASAEPMQTPDFQTFSLEKTPSPPLINAPIITVNYTSHNRWNPMFWSGCILRIH